MFELMPFAKSVMNPFYEMDRMTRSFFGDVPAFRTDVQDNGSSYTLEAELPGFRKEDIAIDIDGDRLTIQAQRSDTQEEKTDNYLRRERYCGAYSRSFDISQVESSQITASYDNGILKLELPKKEAAVPAARRLEIQ